MPRKTKEEAQATRSRILDAAEQVFQARGVSATSLHDVALAAGVTRGAVYWHFQNKADLFDAMLSRVKLPLEAATSAPLQGSGPPLQRLREHLSTLFGWIEGDERARRVFDIVASRVEYVDEMLALRERQTASRAGYLQRLQAVLEEAQRSGALNTRVPAQQLAVGLFALVDGLIRHWIFEPGPFGLQAQGLQAVDVYLAGIAAQPAAAKVKPTRVTPP